MKEKFLVTIIQLPFTPNSFNRIELCDQEKIKQPIQIIPLSGQLHETYKEAEHEINFNFSGYNCFQIQKI